MSRRKRQSFSDELKKEIAHAYATKALSSQQIEARGIRMGNVHRWVKQFPVEGGHNAPSSAAPQLEHDATHDKASLAMAEPSASITPPIKDIRTLTKRELKRTDSGRYLAITKDSVTAALKTMSPQEVHEITGIGVPTLYLWKTPPKSKTASPGTAVVPINGGEHANGVALRKAEVLVNPMTTDAMLVGIRKSEGFANLDKAVKQLKAAHRAGLIEDYDEIDLRLLLGYRQLTGGMLRSRK